MPRGKKAAVVKDDDTTAATATVSTADATPAPVADVAADVAAAAATTTATGRPRRAAAAKKVVEPESEPEEPAPKRGSKRKAAATTADADADDKTEKKAKGGKRKADAVDDDKADDDKKDDAKAADDDKADDDKADTKTTSKRAKKGKEPVVDVEVKQTKTIMLKGKAPVDAECPQASSTHVYSDSADIYDATLNQTDVSYNEKGHNKYYIIQLLESDDNKQYYCWTRWGRVGAKGQSSLMGPFSLDIAKREFLSKFHDKTRNHWASREKFVHHSGKYDLIKVDYSATSDETEKKDSGEASSAAKAKPKEESKLPAPVQSLMELIFNVKAMEAAVLEMNYDTKKAPLGKLTKEQVKYGYEALKEIETLIKAGTFNGPALNEANNKFYTRIPHDFGMRRPTVINSLELVEQKVKLLEALGEIEIAMKAISATSDGGNPVDRHYQSLNCDLVPIDKDSDEFKLVNKYVQQTHGKTHSHYTLTVEDVFVVGRKGEEDRFRKDIPNHQLLWHGSRTTNYCGILSQGLRIAPPEAPATGYMFGKGVYFADIVSKSANYCFTNASNNTGLMLLCEVALGEANELGHAKYDAHILPKGKMHTKGLGKTIPDPDEYTTIFGDVKVPYGHPIQSKQPEALSGSLMYNEFIVYSTEQVRMRYLLRVKFNYKK